jgi:hypothetical protein
MYTNFIKFALMPSKNKEFFTAYLLGSYSDAPVQQFPLHVNYVHKVFGKHIQPGAQYSALWMYTEANEDLGIKYSHHSLKMVTPA